MLKFNCKNAQKHLKNWREKFMFKKGLMTLIAIAMTAGIFTACAPSDGGGTAPSSGESSAEISATGSGSTTITSTSDQIRVGLSTDEGGVNDKSFNQSADEGVKKAKDELGFEYKVVESKSEEDYSPNFSQLINDGCGLVFGVGYKMEDAVKDASGKFPDTKFALIDAVVDSPNVRSITFKEHEGSFLMGVIAGKMTKTNKVGFLGGIDGELINRFEAGYVAGVKSVNPAAAEDLISRKAVKYADSFSDQAKGQEATNILITDGCDVIYHAAGGAGLGMFQAVKDAKNGGKEVWAIGVDLDQSITVPEMKDIILSSMIKKVDVATYDSAKQFAEGNFVAEATQLGLKEGGVGIAPTTSDNTPQEVIDLVAKYENAIKEGKITVPATLEEAKNFEPVPVE